MAGRAGARCQRTTWRMLPGPDTAGQVGAFVTVPPPFSLSSNRPASPDQTPSPGCATLPALDEEAGWPQRSAPGTTSSSAAAPRAACSRTGSPPIPHVSVLLLEAGGKDDWIWIHIPVGYLYCIGNPRTDWCYRTEPEPGLNGRSILYARGKVLGGCSSINAMLYLRGQARDYDEWAQLTGDSGWSWQNVLPMFMKSEDHWRGAEREARAGRRVARRDAAAVVGNPRTRSARPLAQAGIPKIDDFNGGDNEGVGVLRGESAPRRALERDEGVPAAGDEPPQPDGDDRRAREAHPARGSARDRRRVPSRRRRAVRRSAARDDPLRWRDRQSRRSSSSRASGRARCCRSTASRWRTISAASARTCRTICSSAWRSR